MKNLLVPKGYLYLVVVLALIGATILAMQGADATYNHCGHGYYYYHGKCKPKPGGTPPPAPSPAPSPSPAPGGGGGSGPAGPMVTLTANPSTINRGDSSTLKWTSTNATNCQATGSWAGTKPTSGEEKVSPTQTTLYGIVCTNSVGSGAAQTMVTVVTPTTTGGGGTVGGAATTSPLYVACVVSPTSAAVGKNVTFVAGRSGGISPVTYVWTGDVSGVSQAVTKLFTTPGVKSATVFARDAKGNVAQAKCGVNIFKPIVSTPKPQPTPQPAPAPKPESCNCATTTPPAPVVQPVCRTYTTCTDGSTYIPNGQANGALKNGVPATGETRLVYDAATNQWKLVQGDTSGATNTPGVNTPQGPASLFVTADGNPSRFTFLLIWYFLLLFLIGFIAMIISTLRRR